MQQRLPSLLDPPIAFAHRGARSHAPDNTIESFQLALKLGATGLESDVWLTGDGQVVLDHDGVVKSGLRRRSIREVDRRDLPEHIPTVEELFAACGTGYELSLDVKDPAALLPLAQVVRAAGDEMAARTWLCSPDGEVLAAHRDQLADHRLIHSTRLARLADGPERHAAWLSQTGLDGINLRQDEWSGGLVVLYHRFGRLAFSWDAQFEHTLENSLRMGVDAVYSDHTELMVDVVSRECG